jgi:hypothetical protein
MTVIATSLFYITEYTNKQNTKENGLIDYVAYWLLTSQEGFCSMS